MKIKNIIYRLPILLLALISSCTDLDVDIKSQYTTFPIPRLQLRQNG